MKKRIFSDTEVKQRAVNRGAHVLFELWEEGRGAHSRLLEMLVPENYITIGTSKNGSGWREHVVPLAFIRDKCFEIFEEECGIADGGIERASQFIDTHLKVAYITLEERKKLDFELSLKGKMPDAWVAGDYLARLTAAGINLDERAKF